MKSIERLLLIRLPRTTGIDVTELRALMEGDAKPVVLDVRSHIARKLDPRQLPVGIGVDMNAAQVPLVKIPPDRDVVVYCGRPKEASAARVARTLRNLGYRRVRPLEGGLEAWVTAGGDTEFLGPDRDPSRR